MMSQKIYAGCPSVSRRVLHDLILLFWIILLPPQYLYFFQSKLTYSKVRFSNYILNEILICTWYSVYLSETSAIDPQELRDSLPTQKILDNFCDKLGIIIIDLMNFNPISFTQRGWIATLIMWFGLIKYSKLLHIWLPRTLEFQNI